MADLDAIRRQLGISRWIVGVHSWGASLELAAIDAGAPWSINLTCNAAINAETKTWDVAGLLVACASLNVPALLVHGAEDPRPPCAIDDLAHTIPDAEVHVIDGVGHTP